MGTKAVCLTASQDQIRTEGPGVSVSAQEVELTVCWPQRGAGGDHQGKAVGDLIGSGGLN